MLRLISTLSICSLLFAGACSSIQQSVTETGKSSYNLSSQDAGIARALAAYASGLIAELEEGHKGSAAAKMFVRAATNDPSSYMLANRASTSLLYKGRGIDAAGILESHIDLNPTNYTALLDLAQVYHADNLDEESLKASKRAIQLEPANPAAYIICAGICLASGMIEEALTVLSEGAKDSNADIMSDIALVNAAALVKGGLAVKAIPWFEFSAKHSASNRSRILLILAEINDSLNRKSAAHNAYQRAVSDKSASADAYIRLALFQYKTSFNDAIHTLGKGVERFPQSDALLTSIVYLASLQNRLDVALDIFHNVVSRASENPSAEFFLQLGGLYEQTGAFEKAEETFKKGVSRYPDSHIMLNYLAYMWAEKGLNLHEAEKMAGKALEVEPSNGAYLDTLGWIYFKQNRHDEAKKQLDLAMKATPDDPVITDHLGDVLAKLGRIEEAVTVWQRSYALDASNESLIKKLKVHGVTVKQETKNDAR